MTLLGQISARLYILLLVIWQANESRVWGHVLRVSAQDGFGVVL